MSVLISNFPELEIIGKKDCPFEYLLRSTLTSPDSTMSDPTLNPHTQQEEDPELDDLLDGNHLNILQLNLSIKP